MRGDALLEPLPYAIRHSMACEIRKQSITVWEVAGFLGLSSGYHTTERYAEYSPDHLGAAVQPFDAYFANLGVAKEARPDQINA